MSSTRRTHQRPSDSVDFEHTATLREMEEVSLAEKSYESPLDQRLNPPTQATLSFSVPVTTHIVAATSAAARASRSNSQTSQKSSREKLVIFTDADEMATARNPPSAPSDHKTRSRSSSTKEKSGKTERPLTDPGTNKIGIMTTAALRNDAHVYSADSGLEDNDNIASSPIPTARLVNRLQEIAEKRKQILHELNALQEEEDEILAQLTAPPAGIACSSKSTLIEEENVDPTTSHSRMLFPGTPAVPIPDMSAMFAPSLPRTKTVREPSPSNLSLLRTRHAPKTSTPTALRSNTVKRPPLADKTKDSLELFGSAALIPLSNTGYMSLLHEPESQPHEAAISARKVIAGSERTMRVAPNFGDADETPDGNNAPIAKGGRTSRPSRKSRKSSRNFSSRGRSVSRRRGNTHSSRDSSRGVAAPGRTPGRVRSAEVPHTVARKKWDF